MRPAVVMLNDKYNIDIRVYDDVFTYTNQVRCLVLTNVYTRKHYTYTQKHINI